LFNYTVSWHPSIAYLTQCFAVLLSIALSIIGIITCLCCSNDKNHHYQNGVVDRSDNGQKVYKIIELEEDESLINTSQQPNSNPNFDYMTATPNRLYDPNVIVR